MISDLIHEGMLLHSEKALFPIHVTLLGMLILLKDLQPLKALFPILDTLFGMLMFLRDIHP